jgi:hypothetical protein
LGIPIVVDALIVQSGTTERRTFDSKLHQKEEVEEVTGGSVLGSTSTSIGGVVGTVGGIVGSIGDAVSDSFDSAAAAAAGTGAGTGEDHPQDNHFALTLLLMVATANASHCEPVVRKRRQCRNR